MNRGSTPCFSPTSKMMRSNAGSPEVGMSAGILKVCSLAAAAGASAWLNRNPVTLLKTKSESSANGANLSERKWGNLRGNFIRQNLHVVNDDHKGTKFLINRADCQGDCTGKQSQLQQLSCNRRTTTLMDQVTKSVANSFKFLCL